MPQSPNKITQFWQELKRRKVVRVITVYAAAAFVILELVSIIVEPLKLPNWTLPFVIVLLCIGFIIAIILSWVYDVHPEGGIVKTESAHKVKTETKLNKSNSWKIASYISFAVIVGLIVLNILPRSNLSSKREILDKSIAVLPFTYLSDEQDKQYLADGTMDEIIHNLSKIKDLRVMSRTSVEQYRNTDKTVSEICGELDVAFLLEGSFLKNSDQVRLIVQLIQPGKEGHAWSKRYDRNWQDIFTVQSEVAQLVARELQAAITPEEQELINKIPTTDLTAYEFYQKGMEKYNKGEIENAEDLFNYALEYDTTLALAYSGLARVYWHKHFNPTFFSEDFTFFSEDFMDSVLILADRSISIDPQLSDAYTIKGDYYREHGQEEQAISEYDRAIDLNPNDWMAYSGKGYLFSNADLVKALDNFHKAILRYHGLALPDLYRGLSHSYWAAGFIEKVNFYTMEAFKLDGDSVKQYHQLFLNEWLSGNYAKTMEIAKKGYAIDSSDITNFVNVAYSYMFIGQFEEALLWFKRYVERLKSLDRTTIINMHRIGYAFWKNGYEGEAEYYFKEQVAYCSRIIELGRHHELTKHNYYDLAAVYAFQGDKDKAYENLRIFNKKETMGLPMVTWIKTDPLFDNIRDDKEFQQIVHDVEAKYQAQHERVRQWLEENDR